MTERAIELLAFPEDSGSQLILDLGCGSGLSSEVIEEHGHFFLGMDISADMLMEGVEREVNSISGDLMLADIGRGAWSTLRIGQFDGAVSISVLQWLVSTDSVTGSAVSKLKRLFTQLVFV